MKLRETYKIVFLASLCLHLLSCMNNSGGKTEEVFRYNQPNPITSLDPAFAKAQNNIWAIHHLYNGLVTLDDSLKVVPDIAKRWSISDGGQKVVFYLRDDVFFHKDICFGADSTRKVTAEDFVYSLYRLNDDELNAPGSWLFADKSGDKPLFEALDDTTFVINLAQPFMPILGMLTMQYCSVVPQEAVSYYEQHFRSHPVGTGPYKLRKWVEDQGLYLEQNNEYFDFQAQRPKYIKTTFISDKQVAMYELLNGNLDMTVGIESSFINDILTKEGTLQDKHASTIQYVKTPYLNVEYIGINQQLADDIPFLGNKYFRQALNYAVDRSLMLKVLRNGVGTPATSGFVPQGLPGFDGDNVVGYDYNPKRARKLLDSIGYDGSLIELSTNNEYLDLCTFLARQWESVGIKVKIQLTDTGILRDGMRKGTIPFFRASWIADYPDEESFLCMYYSNNPAPPNYTRFANERYDRLYQQSLGTSDINDRIALYQEMDKILVEEAPVVFLFYDQSSVFLSKRVVGYTNNGLNQLNIDFELTN